MVTGFAGLDWRLAIPVGHRWGPPKFFGGKTHSPAKDITGGRPRNWGTGRGGGGTGGGWWFHFWWCATLPAREMGKAEGSGEGGRGDVGKTGAFSTNSLCGTVCLFGAGPSFQRIRKPREGAKINLNRGAAYMSEENGCRGKKPG